MAEENLGPSPFSPVDLNERALILSPGTSLQALTLYDSCLINPKDPTWFGLHLYLISTKQPQL